MLALTKEESLSFSAAILEKAKARLGEEDAQGKEEAEQLLQEINPTTWAFHRIVFEHGALLQFLEEGVFDPDKMQTASYLSYNPSFVRFISPAFAHAFLHASKEALQKKDDFQTLLKLVDFTAFLLPAHRSLAFAAINDSLASLQQTLNVLSWEQFVQTESILDFVFSFNWPRLINALPDECQAQRNGVVQSLLQVLKRFRLDASPDYLKAVCTKLRQLKIEPALQNDLQEYENSFVLQASPQTPETKTKKPHWIYYLAGGLVLALAGLFLFLKLQANTKRETQPEDKYMDAVETTSAKDQLNSSVNEHNLKGFFYLSSQQENAGTAAPLSTGATPISGVTKLPGADGNSQMLVRNETSADALLFYFGSDNPLVNQRSRLIAVYIKSGEEYRFRFQPDFGRFNFLFGKEWVRLDNPVYFPFYQGEAGSLTPTDSKKNFGSSWIIRSFFRRVLSSQPWLNHDLIITNVEQQTVVSSATPAVYTLLNEKEKSKRYSDEGNVAITLQETGDGIAIKAKASLYVYKSPKTFDASELR